MRWAAPYPLELTDEELAMVTEQVRLEAAWITAAILIEMAADVLKEVPPHTETSSAVSGKSPDQPPLEVPA